MKHVFKRTSFPVEAPRPCEPLETIAVAPAEAGGYGSTEGWTTGREWLRLGLQELNMEDESRQKGWAETES